MNKLKILFGIIFITSGCDINQTEPPFDTYYTELSSPLSGETISYHNRLTNTYQLEKNTLGIFTLGEKLPQLKEAKTSKNSNYLLGYRVLGTDDQLISAIAIYFDDSLSQHMEGGLVTDYYTYAGKFGEPIKRKEKKYVVLDTKNAYLMLGFYSEIDYFVALIKK